MFLYTFIGKVLNKLAHGIAAKHKELEQINNEISLASSPTKHSTQGLQMPISNISQWMDTYRDLPYELDKDRKKTDHEGDQMGLLTSFAPSSKIYGGTAHHRSFKSSSLVMKKGRITN